MEKLKNKHLAPPVHILFSSGVVECSHFRFFWLSKEMNQHKTCLEATYPTGRLVGKSYCGATWCYMVLAVPCFLFLSFPFLSTVKSQAPEHPSLLGLMPIVWPFPIQPLYTLVISGTSICTNLHIPFICQRIQYSPQTQKGEPRPIQDGGDFKQGIEAISEGFSRNCSQSSCAPSCKPRGAFHTYQLKTESSADAETRGKQDKTSFGISPCQDTFVFR